MLMTWAEGLWRVVGRAEPQPSMLISNFSIFGVRSLLSGGGVG